MCTFPWQQRRQRRFAGDLATPLVRAGYDRPVDSAVVTGVAGRDRVLIVDDDNDARTGLADVLRGRGFRVETARDGFKALRKLEDFAPDLLVTDLRMPGMDGLALARRAREIDPDSVAIVMTAYGAVDSALGAIRDGVTDYVLKPFRIDDVLRVIEPALAQRRLRRDAARLRAGRVDDDTRLHQLVGASPVMRAMFDTLVQVAPSRASVLVTGESGTGKELVARALHELSPRAAGPFVTVHAAALAETLLESELFGHERGAFTGAAARREGRFQQAQGGTLFLDEIGDLSLMTQVKLLRFLQEREFERVGGNQTIKVDVRVVAATNADLREKVRAGAFREDLFYRLNVISIAVPPLRAGRTRAPGSARLAGQRPRARERDRAGGRGLPGRRDRGRGSPPGGGRRRAARRRRAGGAGRDPRGGGAPHHPGDARAHRRLDLARRRDPRRLGAHGAEASSPLLGDIPR